MSLIDIERAIQIIRTNKADTEQVRRLGHSVRYEAVIIRSEGHREERGGIEMDKSELKQYLKENLINRDEAVKITKQSKGTFSNAVLKGYIPVFYDTGSTKLFLREEIEQYAVSKEERAKHRLKGKDMQTVKREDEA